MVKKRATPADAQLDSVDRAIVEQLQHDGRMPFTKIGGAVGLSEAAARQRVQRLLDAGVIQVVAVTNPLSLGKRRMAMIGVRVSGPVEGPAAAVENIEGVEYLVVTAGQFDLMCEVLVADDSGLLSVTNQLRAIPGVVNTETFVYLDLIKQNYEWGAH